MIVGTIDIGKLMVAPAHDVTSVTGVPTYHTAIALTPDLIPISLGHRPMPGLHAKFKISKL